MMDSLSLWLTEQCNEPSDTILAALKLSPSSLGYIYGALSEFLLIKHLERNDYEVARIKEKPSGGYAAKKPGYKGDFLINKHGTTDYYVVECKGLKTNSEFRQAATNNEDHIKHLTHEQAIRDLKSFFQPDKPTIFENGLNKYNKAKEKWENAHPGHRFPDFRWTMSNPGPNNADISAYFADVSEIRTFVESSEPESLSETSFRNRVGLYAILQTHEPSERKDPYTEKTQAGPLVSDFSIMAVDLFLRTGRHEFVFMNPDTISHSPGSPNHLYQNYTIDVLIPGIKDNLNLSHPWYSDIDECITSTNPKKVEYDASQLDYR